MEVAEHLEALGREAAAVAAAVRRGTDAPVSSCPGWTVGDVAAHLGVTHRWAAEIVRTRADSWLRGAKDRWGIDPKEPGLAEWVETGAGELVGVLRDTDPDTPLWTLAGPGQARFWARRQAHETAVHRWDAEVGHGSPSAIEGELAADGIDEFLSVIGAFRRGGSERDGEGETVHFHRTDGDGEWLVRFPAGGKTMEVSREHAKGDAAARGSGSDLMLFLWGRVPVDRLEVFGDAALLERWFELVPPP